MSTRENVQCSTAHQRRKVIHAINGINAGHTIQAKTMATEAKDSKHAGIQLESYLADVRGFLA